MGYGVVGTDRQTSRLPRVTRAKLKNGVWVGSWKTDSLMSVIFNRGSLFVLARWIPTFRGMTQEVTGL